MASTTTQESKPRIIVDDLPNLPDTLSYSSLFRLPYDVRNILIPKFNYIVSSMKGDSKTAESTHYVDALDFRGDPDTQQENNPRRTDENKVNKLKQEYRELDKLLINLEAVAPNVYQQVFNGK